MGVQPVAQFRGAPLQFRGVLPQFGVLAPQGRKTGCLTGAGAGPGCLTASGCAGVPAAHVAQRRVLRFLAHEGALL